MKIDRLLRGPSFGRGIAVLLLDRNGNVTERATFNNLLLNQAQVELFKRWFAESPGARTISKIAIGSGTNAPAVTDTALAAQIASKTISSSDITGQSSIPPSRICLSRFDLEEANGSGTAYVREVALLFDDNVAVTRALIAQGIITGATQANPVVITSAAHGLPNGAQVYIEGVGGMTQLNGNHYTVANVTTDTFELSGINGTGYGAFSANSPVTEKWTREYVKDDEHAIVVQYPVGLSAT